MASSTAADDDEALKQFSCVYFGFASNLSPRSLRQRCPGALYIGLAVLKGWKFIISELGFGNIVPGSEEDVVYGTLNFLTRKDEEALDKSEEVPHWHQKKTLKVRRIPQPGEGSEWSSSADELEVTTYVDVERTTEGVISKEYITWIRKAIDDGKQCGVPAEYFDKYWKKFLPEGEDVGKEDKIMMMRTIQFDKTDLGYVPRDVRKLTGTKETNVAD